MPDRIYITYNPVVSNALLFHAAIHYEKTNALGQVVDHLIIEAGPQNTNLSLQDKINGVLEEFFIPNFGPSKFGLITAEEKGASLLKPTIPIETISSGDDLSSNWNAMKQFVSTFNNAGYAYDGSSQNSNTFASAALSAGVELYGGRHVFPNTSDTGYSKYFEFFVQECSIKADRAELVILMHRRKAGTSNAQ